MDKTIPKNSVTISNEVKINSNEVLKNKENSDLIVIND